MSAVKHSLQARIASEENEKEKRYWVDRFAGGFRKTKLPYDFLAGEQVSGYASLDFQFPSDLGSSVVAFANKSETRLLILLSAGLLSLGKYFSAREEQLIGTPAIFKEGAGSPVNSVLPLSTRIGADMNLKQLLKLLKTDLTEAVRHQNYPIALLPEKLGLGEMQDGFPLFEIGLSLAGLQSKSALEGFDLKLHFHFQESKDGLALELVYEKGLYKTETLQHAVDLYQRILASLLADPLAAIGSQDLLRGEEGKWVLEEWQGEHRAIDPAGTVMADLEAQWEKHAERTAVVCEGKQLNYAVLRKHSNALGKFLKEKGIGKENVVAIWSPKTIDLIPAMLGVWKAGGAFLPISHETPVERLKFILKDCQAALLLTSGGLQAPEDLEIDHVDLDGFDWEQGEGVEEAANMGELAYIIYTSGSTGLPKGVRIHHSGLYNMSHWHRDYFGVTKDDRIGQFSGIGFDASILDIFPYLLAGASIYLIPSPEEQDPLSLNDFFHANDITVSFLPTPVYEQFAELENKSLRILLTGAEKLRHFKPRSYQLYNNYGPTECTVISSAVPIHETEANIPIGFPAYNASIYILERKHLKPLPPGLVGELFIGGAGVSMGYVNRPNLTAERFITVEGLPHKRLYRTGDLGRWRADGLLEFMGRADQQVKLRGFRIELQEIENVLLGQPGVTRALVRLQGEGNDRKLVAYVESPSMVPTKNLTEALGKTLPAYMVPSELIVAKAFPVDSAGRIDKVALTGMKPQEMDVMAKAAAKGEVEEKLLEMWRLVLKRDDIGVTDKFFKIGGHSLQATRLVSKSFKEFKVRVSLREFYSHSSIRELAVLIKAKEKEKFYKIPRSPKDRTRFPLSYAQQRLWIQEKIHGGTSAYHVPGAFEVRGPLDEEVLAMAVDRLAERHAALRTVIEEENGEPAQVVREGESIQLEVLDLSMEDKPEQVAMERGKEAVETLFDLKKGPLARFYLYRLGAERHFLLLNMHHIISDGVSLQLLFSDALELYSALAKGEDAESKSPAIQYGDYALWHRSVIESGKIAPFESYWRSQFPDAVPTLDLPLDHKRQEDLPPSGARVEFSLSPASTKAIWNLAKAEEASLFQILFTLTNAFLFKVTGQSDLVLGVPMAGREHADLQEMLGFFVNTLPLRTRLEPQTGFAKALRQCKETAIQAAENQIYPVDLLVEWLGDRRASQSFPLYNVVLQVQNRTDESEGLTRLAEETGLKLNPSSLLPAAGKFDMVLFFEGDQNDIQGGIEYDAQLFDEETILYFQASFERLTELLLQDTQSPLQNLIAQLEMEEGGSNTQITASDVNF